MLKRLFAALFLILLLTPSAGAERITLSTGEDQSNNRSAYLNALIMECFRRMNVDVDIQFVPHKRALEGARLQRVDGTFIRSKLIAQTCPELVMVPRPLITSKVTVFAVDPSILKTICGWESLAPYRVAYISGWQWVDRYLPACKEVHQIKKKNSLLLFLTKDRADVAVYEEVLGSEEIRTQRLENILSLACPLSVAKMYLYMHRRHAGMVPDITKTLRQMQQDGTFETLRLKHLGH